MASISNTMLYILSFLLSHSKGQWICQAGVQHCPDGSTVSRDINNNCEFPACPLTLKPWPISIPPMLPPSPMPPLQPIRPIQSCCNPSTRPDGTNANPICFEGSACCPDGSWSCSIGDGKTFSCGGALINTLTNPHSFGTICTTTSCLSGQCLDPFGTCAHSVLCKANPCDVTSCHIPATCEPNYCGGCHAIFKDTNGKLIHPISCDPVGCGINHCNSYNDGCNACSCTPNGVPICTARFCPTPLLTKSFCTGCEVGYMLINNKCEAISCTPGYIWNPTTGSCEGCMCPMVYNPVCCSDGKTYGNICEATCQHATGCEPGQCAVTITAPFISAASVCGGFANCVNYNDGCNDCFCGNGIAGCTRKMCFVQGTPKCTRCEIGYRLEGNICVK